MNEYQKAANIIKLCGVILEPDVRNLLDDFITDRLEELKLVGVAPGKTQAERDTNSGNHLELSNLINRLNEKYDDARELLQVDNSAKAEPTETTGG